MTSNAKVSFFVPGFGAFADAHNRAPQSEVERIARGDDPEFAAEAAGMPDAQLFKEAMAREAAEASMEDPNSDQIENLVLTPIGADVGHGGPN